MRAVIKGGMAVVIKIREEEWEAGGVRVYKYVYIYVDTHIDLLYVYIYSIGGRRI